MMPANAKKRHVVVEERFDALREYAETTPLNKVEKGTSGIGIITAGNCYNYAKEVYGENASYLKLGLLNPLPAGLIRDFAAAHDTVIVIEELDPVIEDFCKTMGLNVIGKNVLPLCGEYSEELLKEKLLEYGCKKVAMSDLARDDMFEAVEDAFRYGKLVLASPTYNADVFPFMRTFIHHLTSRGFQNRTVGLIENGSWAPTAAKVMRSLLEGSKNIAFTDTTVTVRSVLNDESRVQIDALAKELCK
jgi:hypothetical protein